MDCYQKILLSEAHPEVIEQVLQKNGFRPYQRLEWEFRVNPYRESSSIYSQVLPIEESTPLNRFFATPECRSAVYYSYQVETTSEREPSKKLTMDMTYYNLFYILLDSLEQMGTVIELAQPDATLF